MTGEVMNSLWLYRNIKKSWQLAQRQTGLANKLSCDI